VIGPRSIDQGTFYRVSRLMRLPRQHVLAVAAKKSATQPVKMTGTIYKNV
jgi:hypothetical protein